MSFSDTPPPDRIQLLGILGTITGMVLILIIFTRFWLADSYYAKAKILAGQESQIEAYDKFTKAVMLRPDEPVYQDDLGLLSSTLATSYLDNNEATEAGKLMNYAVTLSTKALKISPQNVNFWKTRAKILFALGSIDAKYLTRALEAIQAAGELAPTDAKITYNTAVIMGHIGKNSEAIDKLKQTIELKADYRDAYIALAIFYQEEGQPEKARETLQIALKLINPDDAELKQRLEQLK